MYKCNFGIKVVTFYDENSFLKFIDHPFLKKVCLIIVKSFWILTIKIYSFSLDLKCNTFGKGMKNVPIVVRILGQFNLLYKQRYTNLKSLEYLFQSRQLPTNTQLNIRLILSLKFLSKISATSWVAYASIHILLTSPLEKPSKFALIIFLKATTLFMVWQKKKKKRNKDLLFFTTKKLYFIFNYKLDKEICKVSVGSPLGSSLAIAFLAYQRENWLNRNHFE